MGEASVNYDVREHRYKDPNKHLAALAWLAETRAARERSESWRFWSILT